MSERRPRPGVEARLRALAERPVSAEEAARALATTTPEGQTEQRALIRWFVTRHPTPAARLAYARQAARRLWRPARIGEGPA